MKRVCLAGSLLVICGGVSVAAQPQFSATELVQSCSDGTAYYDYGRCAGYIMGVHDAAVARDDAPGMCLPPNEGISDAVVAPVAAYLASADTTRPAVDLVMDALREAFPC